MKYPLYNNKLCPDLWNVNEDGYKIDEDVRIALLQVAEDFVAELEKNHNLKIEVEDVIVIGSITNYNWSPYSDIDLHIVTNFSSLTASPEEAVTMFDAIKGTWNLKHNITMKGHDVELYVQDKSHLTHSDSEYSILRNMWIKPPTREKKTFNKELIKKKYLEYKKQLDSLISTHDESGLKKLLDKLYKYRQAGLDTGGDLSEENIVFKIFRAKGDLDKLKDYITSVYDKEVSVKEENEKTTNTGKIIALHVTHGKFLNSILKTGLRLNSPSLGKDEVDDNGIYFFPDETTLSDAWDAWLEDFFDEDEKVFCLRVDITGLPSHVGGDYEIIVTQPIPPSRIIDYKEIT